MTVRQSLKMWTIYYSPKDYPGRWVVRAFETFGVRGVPEPEAMCTHHDSLDEARAALPPGLFNMHRDPGDEPQIVETWV